ncbi:MAG: CDC27 family protein [Planctomycetota bacterium]
MLRFQSVVSTGAAALLVVPVMTGDDGEVGSLEEALHGTTRALEVLRGIEQRADAGGPNTVPLIQKVTEPPLADGPVRENRLETLRQEVSLLQSELDILESRRLRLQLPPEPAQPGPMGVSSPDPQSAPDELEVPVTTGLSAEQLVALRQSPDIVLQPGGRPTAGTVELGAVNAFEPTKALTETTPTPRNPKRADTSSDYSAAPMRHAKTCLRAGRYAEGFELIRHLEDPDARYLQARLLEKLGRLDEAIEVLELVLTHLPAGYEAQRAKSDLEFFHWKRDFLKRLPNEDAGGGR